MTKKFFFFGFQGFLGFLGSSSLIMAITPMITNAIMIIPIINMSYSFLLFFVAKIINFYEICKGESLFLSNNKYRGHIFI